MKCDCENLTEECLKHSEIKNKLEFLGESDYKDGIVCGEFEITYWYECKNCNNIYYGKFYDLLYSTLLRHSENISKDELLKKINNK